MLFLLLGLVIHQYSLSQDMRYVSSGIEPVAKNIPADNQYVPLQRLVIVTTGAGNPLSVTRLVFGNQNKSSGFTVLYSGSRTNFSNARQVAMAGATGTSALKIEQPLLEGENYFWICGLKSVSGTNAAAPQIHSFDLGLQDYQPVWADEFDGDTINTNNWGFEKGFVRNEEHQWYQPANATCKNGILVIEARKEKRSNPLYVAGSNNWRTNRAFIEYTSSSMLTKGKQQWLYGRFELRARIDTVPGYWPAWWSLGLNKKWPENGEIDMMEYYRGRVLANIAVADTDPRKAFWFSNTKPVAAFPPGWKHEFHIWRMDWDEEGISLYLDGVLLNYQPQTDLYNRDGNGFYPFRHEQYMLINLAIGGENGGDPAKSTFPLKYEVDYVRVSQKIKDRYTFAGTYQPVHRSMAATSLTEPNKNN